ncbi:Beta-galactosidase GanA [Flaviramulus basaltis]|uniref:Beta-galactosidase GanA n=1 Tax=Flaviramulus basaltis TaxID=369401 RepID=A0A1K2IID9_9FLAO|nr:Beta-galactosidase GanA [Flaviramulus basaltis]
MSIVILLFISCNQSKTSSISEEESESAKSIPHLKKQGNATELIVDDQPYTILGGELSNSTFTSIESMEPVWERLKTLNLNTVLAPVYWELIEPTEGEFDFKLLDDLIIKARNNDLKLVLLWFGSWKNSMSSHVPSWVKKNQEKYPRVKDDSGKSHEILTPFSNNNLQADLTAFKTLMQHIKEFDGNNHTVIMVQPENEIGMLPTARDYHPLANEKFKEDVPKELMDYLQKNERELVPEFYTIWNKNGLKINGTWEEVFGKGLHTDEIFMAWYFAQYTKQIIDSGKEIYPLPMFVNAALNRPNKNPGEYPSAGPLPHLMDVWKAGCSSVDMLSPDFYFPNIKYWCDLYARQNNTLFIPEHRFDNTVAAKALFTIGHYESLGFSPFSIEQIPSKPLQPKEEKLAKVYDIINQIKPILDINKGQNKIEGVLLDKDVKEVLLVFGDYEFKVSHTFNLGWEPNSSSENWEPSGAIIIQNDENEFFYAGFGVSLTFKNIKNPNLNTGILKAEKGYFKNGNWNVYQHLNGDQTHQGRHIRSFNDDVTIQRFTLYDYE